MVALKKSSRKQTEITSPVVFRIAHKLSGRVLGYGVKSDRTNEIYYVTARRVAPTGEWRYFCSCPATCECKHLRAVKEVVAARKELQKEAAAEAASYDVVAEAAKVAAEAESATLDSFYSERGAALQAAREASAAELLRIDAETQASMAAEASKRPHATCLYCGGNHNSSACYL